MALLLGCGDDVSGTGSSDTTSSSSTDTPCLDVTACTLGDATVTVDSTATTSSETSVDPDSTSESSTSTSESTGTTGDPFDPFGPGVELPIDLDFEPLALALADFDGDGVLDLLVTGTAASVVTGATLLGDGNGGFGAPIAAEVTACSAFPIFGAIDDDDAADLFFGTCGVDAILYTADGDGTFTPIDLLDDWSFPAVRSSGFFDHDGVDDLELLTVDGMGQVRIHVAHGGFAPPWPVSTSDVALAGRPGFAPNILTTADLDADAISDAVLVMVDADAAWFRGFDPAGHDPAGTSFALELEPSTVLARRLQGDDDIDDVVFAGRADGVLQVVRGAKTGPGSAESLVDLGGLVPLEIAAGDFDGDGDDDLASVDVTLPTFVVLEGEGAAQFTLGPDHELPSLAVRLLAGDLNDDAKTDLVAATFPNGSITVLLAQ